MDITPAIPGDRQVIDGYGPGFFRVRGKRRESALIVFPGMTVDWSATAAASLREADLAPLIEARGWLEVVLIGTGDTLVPVPKPFRTALREAGIGVELMDTGAACRTYNVLLAEGRHVAAALIPLSGD